MQLDKNMKYAVGLSITANSFFDPQCGANLFKSSPIYQFNHKPTDRILNAVKSGRLIDIKRNTTEVEVSVDTKKLEADITAKVELEMRAKLDEEYKAKLDEAIAEATTIQPTIEVPVTKVEEKVEEKAVVEEAKVTSKGGKK